MSMRTWTIDGLGFELFNGSNAEIVFNFLKNNKDNIECNSNIFNLNEEDLAEAIENAGDLEGLLNDELDCNPASYVAQIINNKECLSGFCGEPSNDDYDSCVLWEPLYPWQLSPQDKLASEEKIREILCQYAAVLGIPVENVDYMLLEYYG